MIDEYLLIMQKNERPPREIRRYQRLKTFEITETILSELRPKTAAEFRDFLLDRGLQPPTARLYLVALSSIYKFAIEEKFFTDLNNPFWKIKLPKKSEPRNRRLRFGEEEVLLEKARELYDEKFACFIIIAIETAMRNGEIQQFKPEDIMGRKVLLRMTKNGEARAVCVFHAIRPPIPR